MQLLICPPTFITSTCSHHLHLKGFSSRSIITTRPGKNSPTLACPARVLDHSQQGQIQYGAGWFGRQDYAVTDEPISVSSVSSLTHGGTSPPIRSIRRRAFQRTTRGALHSASGYQHPHTFPAVCQPRKAFRLPRLFPNFPLHPHNRYRIGVHWFHAVSSIGWLHPNTHNESWMMLRRAKRMKKNPHCYKSIQSGTSNTIHRLRR